MVLPQQGGFVGVSYRVIAGAVSGGGLACVPRYMGFYRYHGINRNFYGNQRV